MATKKTPVDKFRARLDRLSRSIDEEHDGLCQGDLATLEACWKWRIGLLGKPVLAECPDGSHSGRLLELGWDGVHLELPGGEMLCLRPESVRQLVAE